MLALKLMFSNVPFFCLSLRMDEPFVFKPDEVNSANYR
jgi:hypothetical protein